MQGSLIKAREEERSRQEEEQKRVWANDGIALLVISFIGTATIKTICLVSY